MVKLDVSADPRRKYSDLWNMGLRQLSVDQQLIFSEAPVRRWISVEKALISKKWSYTAANYSSLFLPYHPCRYLFSISLSKVKIRRIKWNLKLYLISINYIYKMKKIISYIYKKCWDIIANPNHDTYQKRNNMN